MKTISRKLILVLLVFAAAMLAAACSGQRPLPEDVRAALVAYWDSLPTDPGLEYSVVRSWPGQSDENPHMEIWCVETEISASPDPALEGETLIWIVMRPEGERVWSAAMLATMSSIWPYEACGQAPGSG